MEQFNDTQCIIEMNKNLGEINAKLGHLCNTIASHESRITILEKHPSNQPVKVKDNLSKWLTLALIVSLGTIATLTGSAGLIKAILVHL